MSPFKKTKEGWVHDSKAKNRIPTKPGLFEKPPPPVRDGHTGHPIKNGEIDWERVLREINERNNNENQ